MLSGAIVIWSKDEASIPDGWFKCDGNNGTPNLTSKFVIGAGNNFDVGDLAAIDAHGHTLTTDGHGHLFNAGVGLDTGAPLEDRVTINVDTGQTNGVTARAPFFNLFFIMLGF